MRPHHSRNNRGRARRACALALAGLALAGCAYLPVDAEALRLRKAPPQVFVAHGGPSGELLAGPIAPAVPEELVDATIGDELRMWLTPMERRLLAGASQSAAVAVTGTPVSWQPLASLDPPAAAGAAMPVGAAYRSVRGRVCRDIRKSVERSERPLEQQVTLCRADEGANLFVWLVADSDR
jgi:hypothetical protein